MEGLQCFLRTADRAELSTVDQGLWRSLFAPRTAQFCHAFSDQARLAGILLVPVMANRGTQEALPPSGRDSVLKLIDEAGGRFLGTLIVSSRGEFGNPGSWVFDLARSRRSRTRFPER